MDLQTIRNLIEYHKWANRKVWECVDSVSQEQYTQDHDYSVGSLHKQVHHVLLMDWSAFYAIANGQQWPNQDIEGYFSLEDVATKAAAWDQWDQIEAYIDEVVAELTEERLTEQWTMPAGQDVYFQTSLGELLQIMVNHATNHRAQILALVHQYGGNTTEMGLYFYLAETRVAVPAAD